MDPTGRARDVHFRQIRKCFFFILKRLAETKAGTPIRPSEIFPDLCRPSYPTPRPSQLSQALLVSSRLSPAAAVFSGKIMLPITYLDSLLARLSLLDATDAADAADVTDRSDAIDVIEASIPGAPRASLCRTTVLRIQHLINIDHSLRIACELV